MNIKLCLAIVLLGNFLIFSTTHAINSDSEEEQEYATSEFKNDTLIERQDSLNNNELLALAESFGIEHLKEWWEDGLQIIKLSKKSNTKIIKKIQEKRKKIEQNNKKRLLNAIILKDNENLLDYEEALKANIKNGCYNSMFFLGKLIEEKGDAEINPIEKQKHYAEAFSWYMLSYWIAASMAGNQEELEKNIKSPYEKLMNFINKEELKVKYKNSFISMNKDFFKPQYFSLDILYKCIQIFSRFYIYDKKFMSLSMHLTHFIEAHLLDTMVPVCKKTYNMAKQDISRVLHNKGYYHESSFFWCKAIDTADLIILIRLIYAEYRNKDETNKPFNYADKDKVLSKIIWKLEINSLFFECLRFVKIFYGPNNKKLTKQNIEKLTKSINEIIKKIDQNNSSNEDENECVLNFTHCVYEKKLNFDLEGKEFFSDTNRYNFVAELYRKTSLVPSLSEVALSNIASMIRRGDISTDDQGNHFTEDKRYEIAASLYKKSLSLENFALLIIDKKINTDWEGNTLLESNRYEIAADLLRKMNNQISLLHIAQLIANNLINTDLNGNPINLAEKNDIIYNIIKKIRNKININIAKLKMAKMISDELINIDYQGNLFDKKDRYYKASELYLEANNYESCYNLSLLYYYRKINTDLKGNPIINEQKRYKIIESLLQKHPLTPLSKHLLGMIKIESPLKKLKKNKEDALKLFEEAYLDGHRKSYEYYIILHNELNHESCTNKEDSSAINPLQEEHDTDFPNSENDDSEIVSSPEEYDDSHLVSSPEEKECSDDGYTCTSSSNVSSASYVPSYMTYDDVYTPTKTSDHEYELNELQRRNLKEFKKSQKQKEKNRIFKKMLTENISQPERDLLISNTKKNTANFKILWSKKAKEQLNNCLQSVRKKIYTLINDIQLNGNRGKPEKLMNTDLFSRRINAEDRIIYRYVPGLMIEILQCIGHYDG
ncbi:MAG: type II toxin-antitoxin system YoeB family toxin [Alphaproteobacteria bacterium]|nr:type II toxin-antitoxin system YoeB family toxin [Alphaproteobacteria bacterium]